MYYFLLYWIVAPNLLSILEVISKGSLYQGEIKHYFPSSNQGTIPVDDSNSRGYVESMCVRVQRKLG